MEHEGFEPSGVWLEARTGTKHAPFVSLKSRIRKDAALLFPITLINENGKSKMINGNRLCDEGNTYTFLGI